MVLLTAEKISKSYSEKILLNDIVLGISEGDKIGIIGTNGTGKSTLLKIIAGEEISDSGSIIKANGVRVGYLPQNPVFEEGLSVLEYVMHGISASELVTMEYECISMLTKLGIADYYMPLAELSGGQKKRVSLVCALVTPAEILVLDEPTNHVDSSAVAWLEEYLARYRGALIMVTHDRYFLDRVTNKIAELQNGNLFCYQTNYTEYLQLKIEREAMETASERKRQTLLKKELEWIRRGARARSTKQRFRVERFEQMSEQTVNLEQSSVQMASMSSRLGKKIIEIDSVFKGFGKKQLISDFSYNLLRNDRIGFVGENGCGKSTLLKIINGLQQADNGSVDIGETVKIGYFSQECEEMDTSLRVIDYISNIARNVETPEGVLTASQMLEKFLFEPNCQYSIIGKLSGGERRRLYLLGILMQSPNILLFDEPTNDLDIQTLNILEEYLEGFQGAVIVVSHDRYFLDKVVNQIFAFEDNGKIAAYLGGYSDYLLECEGRENSKKQTQEQKPKVNYQAKQSKLKFTFKEQREYDEIDGVVANLESKIEEIDTRIAKQADDYVVLQELLETKASLEGELEQKMERWIYLNELAEKIEEQGNTTAT